MTEDRNNFEMGEAMLPLTTVKFKTNPKNQVKIIISHSFLSFVTDCMYGDRIISTVITLLVREKFTVKLFMLIFNQCPFVFLLTLFRYNSLFMNHILPFT